MVLFLVTQDCKSDLLKPLNPKKDLFDKDLVLLPVTASSEESVKEYARILSLKIFGNKEVKLYCNFPEFMKLKNCKDFQIVVDVKNYELDFSTYIYCGLNTSNIEVLLDDDDITLKELLSEKGIKLADLKLDQDAIYRKLDELSK